MILLVVHTIYGIDKVLVEKQEEIDNLTKEKQGKLCVTVH